MNNNDRWKVMEYLFLFVGLYILIFFFPWYITFYTEGKLKCYFILFGFIRIPVNVYRIFFMATTRSTDDKREFNITEIMENLKKFQSTRPIYNDLARKATIKHFYWYTAVPMETPLGLSILPIYSTLQGYVQEIIYSKFKRVYDVDIDTKYNYINDDTFMYLDCIIKINLAKIISVSVKYIKKMPLLIKRTK